MLLRLSATPSPAVTRRFAGNFEGTPGRLVPGEEVTEPERPRPAVNRKPTRKPTVLQGGAAKRRAAAAAAAAAANAAAGAPMPVPKEEAPVPVQKDLPPLPETPKGGRKKTGVAGRVRAALSKGKRTLAKAVVRRSATAAAARSPAGKKGPSLRSFKKQPPLPPNLTRSSDWYSGTPCASSSHCPVVGAEPARQGSVRKEGRRRGRRGVVAGSRSDRGAAAPDERRR